MREVGAEDRPEPNAHAQIEGPHRCSIVGLAAKIEVVGEDCLDILFRIYSCRLKIVHDMLGPAELFKTALRAEYIQVVHDRVGVGFQSLIPISVNKLMQCGDAGCARVLQTRAAALLPVFDQVEAHLARPADTAFHEAEVEAWVAVYESAEENAAGESMVRFGEVTDVVVGEVADRGAVLPAAAARVLGHGHAEFDTPPPERLIVIGAVEGDGIAVPGGLLPVDSFRRAWDRSLLVSPQHDRFEAALNDRVFQLLKSFIR